MSLGICTYDIYIYIQSIRFFGDRQTRAKLRWIQGSMRAVSVAANCWAAASTQATLRKALVSFRSQIELVRSKSPFSRFKFDSSKYWNAKLFKIFCQGMQLVRCTGFARPDPKLVQGLVVRCSGLSALAADKAQQVEKEFSDKGSQAWKDWVRDISVNGASLAHEFSKEALVPQFQDNFDFSRCRSQLLGQQVGVWSNLWCPPALAPQGPLPDFGPVPRFSPSLPPRTSWPLPGL